MRTTIALAWSIAVAVGAAQRGPAPEVTLRALTVPAERLPPGCALSPTAAVRAALAPAVSPIRENPWVGTDAPVRAMIRERIDGPVVTPDPPGLTRKELATFRLHLADGVDEAYAAVYTQAESRPVVVYAMKLDDAARTVNSASDDGTVGNPGIIRVTLGSIVAMATGDGGSCFQAVAAHLKSLTH
jgi:hypothetical protein